MPIVSSTRRNVDDGVGDEGGLGVILSICAIDDYKLVFALASAADAQSATHSAFDAAFFFPHSGLDDAVDRISPGLRPLSFDAARRGSLRRAFYAHSQGVVHGDDSSSNAHWSGECPKCSSKAASVSGVMSSSHPTTPDAGSRHPRLPPERLGASGAVISRCEKLSSSLAVLRASEWIDSLQKCDGGPRETSTHLSARPPPTVWKPTSSLFSTDTLVALHLVRQEGGGSVPVGAKNATRPVGMTNDGTSALFLSADVFCCFDCGCCAFVTFDLTRDQLCKSESAHITQNSSPRHSSSAGWSVSLSGCVWIPSGVVAAPAPCRGAGADTSRGCLQEFAAGAPLVSSLVRLPPFTASPSDSANVIRNGRDTSLEVLVVWCSHTVAFSCPAASSSTCPRPVLWYVSFRSDSKNPTTSSTLARTWRLYAQGTFDMSDLLHLAQRPSSPSEGFHDSVHRHAFPCASVRSLEWLPRTADIKQSYPLLAVLYAAPVLPHCRVDGVGNCAVEPSLDALAVCYLEEQAQHWDSVSGSGAASSNQTPLTKTGQVRVGPWSVRGLALAHPQFLLAATLARPPPPAMISSPMSNHVFATSPVASSSSAARAFCAARHASAAEAMVLLGIFQRPSQEPYMTSSLCRGVAAAARRERYGVRGAAEMQITTGDAGHTREHSSLQGTGFSQDDINAPCNSNVFAFVLYSAEGEVARCALDGYVDSAQTSWLSPPIAPRRRGGGPREGSDLIRQGDDKERRTVAHICALLAERPSIISATSTLCHSSVVITVQAQWMRAPPTVTARPHVYRARSAGGSGAGDHWSFSVHLSHKLRMSVSPYGWPLRHSCFSSPPQMTGRILCWRFAVAGSDTASGDVRCLVCKYATAPDQSDATARRGAPAPGTLLEGILEFRMSSLVISERDFGGDSAVAVEQAGNAASDLATSGGSAISCAAAMPSEAAAALADPRPWALGSCTRVVSPSAFWASLRSLSVADTLATAFDLLSHTPTLPLVAARLGASVCDGMVPVALAWVSGGAHPTDKQSPTVTASPSSPFAPAGLCSKSVLSLLAGIDAVVLLRSGDVLGWSCTRFSSVPAAPSPSTPRCENGVLHLGSVSWGFADDITPPLKKIFLESLLNRGVGADAVHMEVVTLPTREKSRWMFYTPAGVRPSSNRGARLPVRTTSEKAEENAVLLVLAVGLLVGVADLATGVFVIVRDLSKDFFCFQERGDVTGQGSVAPSSTTSSAPTLTASVLQLHRLPIVSPCGWMRASDVAPNDEGPALGTSWYFMWCGAEEVRRGHSPFSLMNGSATLSCALRLSFISWVDALAAQMDVLNSGTGGGAALAASTVDATSSPSRLITLEVDALWRGETTASLSPTALLSVSLPHALSERCALSFAGTTLGRRLTSATAGVVPYSAGRATVQGTTPNTEAGGALASAVDGVPLMIVCDIALLRSLWPASATHEIGVPLKCDTKSPFMSSGTDVPPHRLPLRLLLWGCVAPRPSLPTPSLFQRQIRFSCVEEPWAGREAATASPAAAAAAEGLTMPLHFTCQSLLGDSCHASCADVLHDHEVDLRSRWACREVLYLSTLTLDVPAVEEVRCKNECSVRSATMKSEALSPDAPGPHGACSSSDLFPWQVLMCTMWLCNGEQAAIESGPTRTSSNSRTGLDANSTATAASMRVDPGKGQAVSYLLCCLPVALPESKTGAAAGRPTSPRFTWHWIPLYISTLSPAPGALGGSKLALSETAAAGCSSGLEDHRASLCVTRVLQLLPHSQYSAPALSPTHSDSVFDKASPVTATGHSYFYCEGMRSSPSATAAAALTRDQHSCYCLSIHGNQLRHLLERSVAGSWTEGVEQVYMYTSVDPNIVRAVQGDGEMRC